MNDHTKTPKKAEPPPDVIRAALEEKAALIGDAARSLVRDAIRVREEHATRLDRVSQLLDETRLQLAAEREKAPPAEVLRLLQAVLFEARLRGEEHSGAHEWLTRFSNGAAPA